MRKAIEALRASPPPIERSSQAIELRYLAVPFTGGDPVPGVQVRFVHPSTGDLSEPVNALIDTGNDETGLPIDWLVKLDVDLSACEDRPTFTAGGTLHGASMDMPKRLPTGLDMEVLGRCIHLPAVVFSPTHEHPVLLGRDFLAFFKLALDQRASRLWLQPYD